MLCVWYAWCEGATCGIWCVYDVYGARDACAVCCVYCIVYGVFMLIALGGICAGGVCACGIAGVVCVVCVV